MKESIMSAITYDALYKEVSEKRVVIDGLTTALTIPIDYINVLILNFSLILVNYRLAKIISKTGLLNCATCKESSQCDDSSKADFLKSIDDIIKKVHEIMEFQKDIAPSFLLRINSHYISIVENEYENCLLGSDEELKSLVSSVSEKVNKELVAK